MFIGRLFNAGRTGHGGRGARAYGHEERVVEVSERFPRVFLESVEGVLVVQRCGEVSSALDEILEACLGGDDERRRHVQGELGHLAQVGALAAKDHLVHEKSEA